MINAIVQARFGSTRLPGKIFKDLSGKPVLWHVVNRLSYSKLCNKIIVATTTEPEDDQTENFCVANNIPYYRGSSDNVLSRYYETAKVFGAEIVIRITSDCPLIDPVILDKMIDDFLASNRTEKLDYLSNSIVRTFPRGLDVEIFSFETLNKTYMQAVLPYELEHVTPYIYQHPELFKLKNFAHDKELSAHRWTVDTPEDYELIKNIYDKLYVPGKIFLLDDILKLFDKNPGLIKINQSIKQKNLGD
ncbi:MAG: glycosyltransferase family protein [Bacteroidota bacterium]